MRARFAKLTEDRRTALMNAVIAEVGERGFEGAAVASIAKRAHVSKASLFYYFTDREDLLAAAVEAWFERIAGGPPAIATALGGTDAASFWTAFGALYRSVASRVASHSADARFARAWIELVQRGTSSSALAPWVAMARESIASVIALGVAKGAVRDDLPRALLERSVLSLALTADHWMSEAIEQAMPADDAASAVVSLFRSAFAREKSNKPVNQ
ncbi:MAG: TetR/AcrR family transcriptional regulator [Myxococcales bacterium]|nr:TetR/AcrR family transcriptional regulator [Myxococcales bacterium]